MTPDTAIRVYLVDDHTMFRAGLASLTAGEKDIEIVGQSSGSLELFDDIRRTQADVVVMDITMPGLNGLDLCRELLKQCPDIEVLILTMHSNEELIIRALQYGASGYLLKEAAPDDFIAAVRSVARGEAYLGAGIPRTVLSQLGRGTSDRYELLTTRERHVLKLIAEGKTNRQIAEELDIALKTIDNHRAHLMRKLDIHDQTALVKFAIRRGIIQV